ncbi:hypothetical protein D3C85_1748030 [compost metagenome]
MPAEFARGLGQHLAFGVGARSFAGADHKGHQARGAAQMAAVKHKLRGCARAGAQRQQRQFGFEAMPGLHRVRVDGGNGGVRKPGGAG